MKKLAIICGTLSRGGAERVTVCLADYMNRNGVPAVIITGDRSEKEYDPPAGVQRISLADGCKNGNSIAKLVYQINTLRKTIREQGVDMVLIMGVPVCIYAVPGCMGTDAKIIVSERNDPRHFAGKKIVKLTATALMCLADGFVFQTEDAKAYYDKLLQSQGTVIPNPLLAEKLPPVYTGLRERTIVSAGRLIEQKNQLMLLDSFAKLDKRYSNYKLVLYGEGPLRRKLEHHVAALGLQQRVSLPGNVTDLLKRIQSASVFVMTSNFEGMPNVLIEAMALGLPCISTDCPCGGPKTLITNGENGVLIPVGDQERLVVELERLLENPEKAQQMGLAAAQIRERLHVERIGMQWHDYLNEINGQ